MKFFSRDDSRQSEFAVLVRNHGPILVIVARRQVGSPEAEDVVQSALLAAWNQFRIGAEIRSPRAWLLRFLVNECHNVVSRRMRGPSHVALREQDHPGSSDDVLAMLQRELVHDSSMDAEQLTALLDLMDGRLARAIRAITAKERMVLLLRAVGGLSYKEISMAVGVPIGTVMSRLGRAREKVRLGLSGSSHEDFPGHRYPNTMGSGEGCQGDTADP